MQKKKEKKSLRNNKTKETNKQTNKTQKDSWSVKTATIPDVLDLPEERKKEIFPSTFEKFHFFLFSFAFLLYQVS